MKVYSILILFVLCVISAKAQTTDVSGTVKDDQGQPVHFVFVKDSQSKSSTFTDSLGNFTLKTNPGSSLYVSAFGYRDTLVTISATASSEIILRTAVNISNSKAATVSKPSITNDAVSQELTSTISRQQIATPGESTKPVTVVIAAPVHPGDLPRSYNYRVATFDAAPGSIFPVFNPKGETQGSRYLYKGWIHGYVINAKDSLIEDPTYLFEYDKMGGGLLMTKNMVSAIEVDREMVQSFTLYDNGNVPFTFENVPQINPSHYVQVLSSGDNYKIYKDIKTTFEKENYSSDGVMTSGHNYDLYADEYTYYVYNIKTKTLQKIALKKKAIKDAFAPDANKLNKFMSDHSSDSIDEMYLAELGASLNE